MSVDLVTKCVDIVLTGKRSGRHFKVDFQKMSSRPPVANYVKKNFRNENYGTQGQPHLLRNGILYITASRRVKISLLFHQLRIFLALCCHLVMHLATLHKQKTVITINTSR